MNAANVLTLYGGLLACDLGLVIAGTVLTLHRRFVPAAFCCLGVIIITTAVLMVMA
jgi:hypothetical protein